jgi:hypothetical protein
LEAIVLRIIRIALLVLLPTLTVGALAAGCGDDTTVIPPVDMAVPDMAKPIIRDMHMTDQ